MKIRVGRVIASAIALAAATLMATSGSASAAPAPPGDGWDHIWSAEGVRLYVEEYGDIVSVCDADANGRSANVQVTDGRGYMFYMIQNTGGYGSCTTFRASQGGTHNLPEGVRIHLYYWGYSEMAKSYTYFLNDH